MEGSLDISINQFDWNISRRTLGVMALKAGGGKPAEAELHRTYDNLTAAYSTEVSMASIERSGG